MNKFFKIFVLFLAFIFSVSILCFFISFVSFLTGNRSSFFGHDSIQNEYDLIREIDIDVGVSSIEIKKGKQFRVDISGNKNSIKVYSRDGVLEIEEKKSIFFSKSRNNKITIVVKEDSVLDDLDISNGAGKILIDGILSSHCSIENGAGTLDIIDSKFNSIAIEGGAGRICVTDSILNNLDLEAGAGSVSLQGKVLGHSKIECGVGAVSLNLVGKKLDYRLRIEKGIGNIEIDGEKVQNSVYGNGSHLLELEGGIGSIQVNFKEE